jgi:hypothetical protein
MCSGVGKGPVGFAIRGAQLPWVVDLDEVCEVAMGLSQALDVRNPSSNFFLSSGHPSNASPRTH